MATSASTSARAEPAERFLSLDLMRGLAALCVLLYHTDYMLGPLGGRLDKGYLAVDFFFMLSGFIIDERYGSGRHRPLQFGEFMWARVARLWPLYFVATLAGAVVAMAKFRRDQGYVDWLGLAGSLPFNLVFLPAVHPAYGADRMFQYNGATWSIFFELLINIVFFVWLRRLSVAALAVFALAMAALLAVFAGLNGNFDGGFTWSTFHIGLLRVSFGFVAGMLVHRLIGARRPEWAGWIGVCAALALCLVLALPGGTGVECTVVFLVFPVLVFLGARARLRGVSARLGHWLGGVSYSVYLLQTPVMMLVAGASQAVLGFRIAQLAPYVGVAFVALMLWLSYVSWRRLEQPAQKALSRIGRAPLPTPA